jgi:hypothetical protein
MDAGALNDAELLTGTPIGDLVVRRYGRGAGVCVVAVVDRHDPDRPARQVHVIDPGKAGGGVLDAIYGKRFWESAAVQKLYADAHDAVDEREAQRAALHSKDFQDELARWLGRSDARDVLFGGQR